MKTRLYVCGCVSWLGACLSLPAQDLPRFREHGVEDEAQADADRESGVGG